MSNLLFTLSAAVGAVGIYYFTGEKKKVKAHNDMIYHISRRIVFYDEKTGSEKIVEFGVNRGSEYVRVMDIEEYVEIPSTRIFDSIISTESKLGYMCEKCYIYFEVQGDTCKIKIKDKDYNTIYDGYFHMDYFARNFKKISLESSVHIDTLGSLM
jgi:hypothetical protein